jgi:hypothetical protein
MHDTNGAAALEHEPEETLPPPNTIVRLLIVALAVIFAQGTLVVVLSNFGRIWPSIDSTKVVLPH